MDLWCSLFVGFAQLLADIDPFPSIPAPMAIATSNQLQYSTPVKKLCRSAQDGECTKCTRNYLPSYAHATYFKKPKDAAVVLPLPHTLIKLHPNHLPSLLLYCACIVQRVEAMSNLGTTQRALGEWAEVEEWWWRAIRLRA
ncbi:uncharacterized protein MELLADRAFT_65026 [Melampsora larici-populina 98AG31]|uniref:Secreted protein n=1 Tax=Melampsora larici-populina (strain 98AG31 / pathotype 3-4-7) TaxID=747676 RepID=F4RTQ4_MELLP|nr:uncharacterized protein MELLADRAFT_65026 [Melampsora larici-populina 98AG31]EGG04299.1 hypothetical protein MELLADRAFT_65026 [Melampsora larici-populina 98AG31]